MRILSLLILAVFIFSLLGSGVQAANEKPPKESKPAVGVVPNSTHQYKPGDTFKDCDDCPEMVVVPAGSIMMGSPESEKARDPDEGPQHRITIPIDFAVGRFEVTFAEWDDCVVGGGCNRFRPDDNGWGRGNHPVINVSWDDAKAYVAWLSRKTGKTYKLLSEAEWEYVARAGTTTPFSTGRQISTDQANFNGNYIYNGSQKGHYRRTTVPVGTFKPNAFGLYDMHGNVLEWTEDCLQHSFYEGAPKDGSAWVTGGDCDWHVRRGGSWLNGPEDLRSANRLRSKAGGRYINYGFRISRTLM